MRCWLIILSFIVGSCAWVKASAQEYKPRIVLVFDTSGSMGIDVNTGLETGGDNSEEHPGNGGLSRLAVAKTAIRGIIETTAEAEFALMRYPQRQALGLNDGRGQFNNNSYDNLDETPLNYAGACDGTVRRVNAETPFSLLVPFAPNNDLYMTRWLDQRENWGDPNNSNPRNGELRATGPTPIVSSLGLAREYFAQVLSTDEGIQCRQNVVVLLTDGSESCVASADREAALATVADSLRSITVNQGGQRFEKDVKVFVLAFAVNQRAINQLSVLARAGGTAVNPFGGWTDLVAGEPYQANDLESLREAFGRILTEAIPGEECDGEDNDCDGRIDEGALNSCGECGPDPQELCNAEDEDCDGLVDEGVLNNCGGCGATPAEICNDADDDCDGRIDEDVANACGGCAAVTPESCNGLDDDCDGRIDNRPGVDSALLRPCSSNIGACREGNSQCRGGEWVGCDGVLPEVEICNGEDDDCDGLTDENRAACGPVELGNVGECKIGFRRCGGDACDTPGQCDEDGLLLTCEEFTAPSDEICDGRDNDCDGESDEGLFNACGSCGELPPEACNGVDDNCDGRIDEDARCPAGYACLVGECVVRCTFGECPRLQACVSPYPTARFCHSTPCLIRGCGPGRICNVETGECDDPCVDLECSDGEVCQLGECTAVPCPDGCADNEYCSPGGCVENPCAGVECGDEEFCRDGECVAACIRAACDEGQVCRDGVCVDDLCGGVCIRGSRCDERDGLCVWDSCNGVSCPPGTACSEGECRADIPCAYIECPAGTSCFDGTCTDRTPSEDPTERPPIDSGVAMDSGPLDAGISVDASPFELPDAGSSQAGSGDATGCGCRSSAGGYSSLAWLLLLATPYLRRRRQKAQTKP